MTMYAELAPKMAILNQIRDAVMLHEDGYVSCRADDTNDERELLKSLYETVGALDKAIDFGGASHYAHTNTHAHNYNLRIAVRRHFDSVYENLVRCCGLDVCSWCLEGGYNTEHPDAGPCLTMKEDSFCQCCGLNDRGESEDDCAYMHEDDDLRDMDSDPWDQDYYSN